MRPAHICRVVGWLAGAVLVLAPAFCDASTGARSPVTPMFVGADRECHELALRRIRETGRSYDARRSGWNENEQLVHVWIGGYLLKIPAGYVNDVGGGAAGNAGISAILVAVLPDMAIAKQPYAETIQGVEPQIYIRLACAPGMEHARRDFTATRTREQYLRTYFPGSVPLEKLDLPELGLVGYKRAAGTSTLYFPKDPNVKNAQGGALAFLCDEAYPPKTTGPRPVCMTRFALRDALEVDYRFPMHFMKYWQVGYRNAVRLLNSFLVEE